MNKQRERRPRSPAEAAPKRLSRRDALKIGGAAAVLAIPFAKPAIRSVSPRPAFADYDSVGAQTQPPALLSLALYDWPDPVPAGTNLNLRAIVTNAGSSPAADVQLAFVLPSNATLAPATSDPRCTESDGVVTCSIGALAAGDSVSVDAAAAIDAATPGGVVVTTAYAGEGPGSPMGSATYLRAATTISAAPPDLYLGLFDWPDPAPPGGSLSYRGLVSNSGVGPATGVVLTFDLPAGVSFDPPGSDPRCVDSGGLVTCAMDPLPGGASAYADIRVTLDGGLAPGSFLYIASTVDSNEEDPVYPKTMRTAKTTVA